MKDLVGGFLSLVLPLSRTLEEAIMAFNPILSPSRVEKASPGTVGSNVEYPHPGQSTLGAILY